MRISIKSEGKTTHKEEFVTCGGVTLKEVHFKTMESKICPGLFFAGEILDIDGVTGGFNFQNAWTTGFIAGTSASDDSETRVKEMINSTIKIKNSTLAIDVAALRLL